MAAARGLRDGAPVCCRYSEIAVGRALGRVAVGGRPARARCAGPGGRRRAAGAGGGRRRCSAETRSPSPRPRVPAQLSLASGTAHLQVRKLGWGLHGDLALPRDGSRRELGDSQEQDGFGERQDRPQGHPNGGGGGTADVRGGARPLRKRPGQGRAGGLHRQDLGSPCTYHDLGVPCTHHHLGASPIAPLVALESGDRVMGWEWERIPILPKPGVSRQHGDPSKPEASRLGDSNPCGAGR